MRATFVGILVASMCLGTSASAQAPAVPSTASFHRLVRTGDDGVFSFYAVAGSLAPHSTALLIALGTNEGEQQFTGVEVSAGANGVFHADFATMSGMEIEALILLGPSGQTLVAWRLPEESRPLPPFGISIAKPATSKSAARAKRGEIIILLPPKQIAQVNVMHPTNSGAKAN